MQSPGPHRASDAGPASPQAGSGSVRACCLAGTPAHETLTGQRMEELAMTTITSTIPVGRRRALRRRRRKLPSTGYLFVLPAVGFFTCSC